MAPPAPTEQRSGDCEPAGAFRPQAAQIHKLYAARRRYLRRLSRRVEGAWAGAARVLDLSAARGSLHVKVADLSRTTLDDASPMPLSPPIIEVVEPSETYDPMQFRREEVKYLKEHAAELSQYAGQFVAIEGGQIVGVAGDLDEVYEQAKEHGADNPFVTEVPEEPLATFVGWRR
jgi:Family of unknown function (DUF5678)